MTEMEFYRMARDLPFATPTHKAILRHVCADNPSVESSDMFMLCYAAVSRVPNDRILKVTLRQLQDEYQLPKAAYLCADPKGEGKL